MSDIQSSMNLPSRSSSVISDLKSGISGMRQETSLLKQEWSGLVQTMGTGASRLALNAPGAGGGSPTKVAADPVFSSAPAIYGAGENTIFSGPTPSQYGGGYGVSGYGGYNNGIYVSNGYGGGSVGNGGNAGSIAGGGGSGGSNNPRDTGAGVSGTGAVLYGAGTALGMANATSDMVQSQLLASRAGAYLPVNATSSSQLGVSQQILKDNGLSSGIANSISNGSPVSFVNQAAMAMAQIGAATDKLDAFNALAKGNELGLGPNFLMGAGTGQFQGSIAQGIANVSNLTPGMGLQGATSAYGSMQQAPAVNMLRGVGIQIRDANGNMKPPDQIIDDLWAKIIRDYQGAYGSGKVPTENELLIAFEPGNSMDSMIGNLFGSDPMVYSMIKNGLLYKAKTASVSSPQGASLASGSALTANNNPLSSGWNPTQTQTNVASLGMTTGATQTFNQAAGVSTQGLALSQASGADAYSLTQGFLTFMGNQMNVASPDIVKSMNALAAVMQTIGGAGNGMGNNFLGTLMSMFSARAEGGPTDAQNVYLVGEKGPELFVPQVDGHIIPNDQLPLNYAGARANGGQVSARGFATDILTGIGAPTTESNIAAMINWEAYEGGVSGDTANAAQNPVAKYNPLDTTQTEPGSVEFNSGIAGSGVQAYTSQAQGEQATLQTLNNGRYQAILDVFKSGTSSIAEVQAAIGSTPWGTFKNSAGSSGTSTTTGTTTAATTTFNQAIASALTSTFGAQYGSAFSSYVAGNSSALNLSSLLGTTVGSGSSTLNGIVGPGTSSGGSSVYNYGGVTFNMNIPGADPATIKTMLQGLVANMQSTVATAGA